MDSKKINVLVVPSDTFGVGLYRSVSPHNHLSRLYGEEFNVEIKYDVNFADLSTFDIYDIIHIHKGLYNNMENFWAFLDYCKSKNIKAVKFNCLDESWNRIKNKQKLFEKFKYKTSQDDSYDISIDI